MNTSQPVHEVRFLYDLKVPMRDGVKLSADVFLPRSRGSFPVILHRTPYENNHERWIKWGIWFAKRGYAYVSQDCRGRFESEGTFYAYHQEGADGYDTLEWIVRQPWCSGKIGTSGRSYGGLTQWQLAPLRSPHLTAMSPHVPPVEYFADYHYMGGAFQQALSMSAAIVFSTNQAMGRDGSADLYNNSRFFRRLPLIDVDVEAIGRVIPFYRDWLAHPTNDDYWEPITNADKYGEIDVPIYTQAGWFDPYVASTMRSWAGVTEQGATALARRSQKVYIGPWTHGMPESSKLADLDFGPAALISIWEEDLRWFDYWLKGVDNGMMAEPPIRLFVMGRNQWRFEQEWPLARTEFTPYYLHSHGRANSLVGHGSLSPEPPGAEPPDRYDYDPEQPIPSIGGNNSMGNWSEKAEEPIIPGPVDQRPLERRDDILVYTSPVLEAELEITGPITLVLYAASSARDTDFTAKLMDVFPTGHSMNLSEGIIRARYRYGWEKMELLERGEVAEYRMEMAPTSYVFKQGHRLRLDISSSNFPRFSRNLNTGEDVATGIRIEIAHQTIFHATQFPSHILLPVIPG